MFPRLFFYLLLSLLIAINALPAKAQSLPPTDALYKEVAHMDSLLFNALNTQDLAVMKTVFDKDLEFYHDKGGLSNYEQNIKAFGENFSAAKKIRRELVAGSTEVYPIKDYGAVQLGAHTFCHPEGGKQDCGTFRFMHVWKRTPEGWRLARVVSYGH